MLTNGAFFTVPETRSVLKRNWFDDFVARLEVVGENPPIDKRDFTWDDFVSLVTAFGSFAKRDGVVELPPSLIL